MFSLSLSVISFKDNDGVGWTKDITPFESNHRLDLNVLIIKSAEDCAFGVIYSLILRAVSSTLVMKWLTLNPYSFGRVLITRHVGNGLS